VFSGKAQGSDLRSKFAQLISLPLQAQMEQASSARQAATRVRKHLIESHTFGWIV
jgi:hypothetical protein